MPLIPPGLCVRIGLIWGFRLGLRKSEWAQDDGISLSSPAKDICGDAKAFCLNDFRFECEVGIESQTRPWCASLAVLHSVI